MRWILVLGMWLLSQLAWAQRPVRRYPTGTRPAPTTHTGDTTRSVITGPVNATYSPGNRPVVRYIWTKPTFHTQGNVLLDPCGHSIVLKGVNKMVYFDNADPNGATSFREIAKTRANCVRIVWQMRHDATGQPTDTQRLDRILQNAYDNKLIPIVGLWDYTETPDGGFKHLIDYAGYWTRPDVLTVIQKHQAYLIINIANEAANDAEHGGDENNLADRNSYANAYKQAVSTLRGVGIQVPLMIDGMDRGKSLRCFVDKGPELLAADPLHNLIFSFHPYWPKTATDRAENGQFITNRFADMRRFGIVLVMGEIAKYGAWPGDSTINPCSELGLVDYQRFITEASYQNIGWMVWHWGPGGDWRQPGDCPVMGMTSDGTYRSLQTIDSTGSRSWMKELAISAPYSLYQSARKTFLLEHKFQRSCPRPGRINAAPRPRN